MKKIKNLHIMPNDKFNKEFIEFINKNFDKEEHYFLLISVPSSKVYNISEDTNSNVLNYEFKTPKKSILRAPLLAIQLIKFYRILYSLSKKAEKVFFHDASNYQIPFLYIFRGILKKSYYLIWSTEKSKYEKKFFIGNMFRYVKGNFKGYITMLEEDYEIIKSDYKATGELFRCFAYPSNIYKKINLKEMEKETLYIQIGNSAQLCNNHIEIFNLLEKYKNENIKLFCILSYGDEGGLENIINYGKNIFGEKFIPITEYMEYSKYMEFLSKIDIAIFGHDIHKALGNITSLLSMKKTVFLKRKISTYKTLSDLGIKLKEFKLLEKTDELKKFSDDILENNKKLIEKNFSENALVEQWKNIFEN